MIKIGFDLDGGDFHSKHNIEAVEKFAKKNKKIEIWVYSKDTIKSGLSNIKVIKCSQEILDDDSILAIRKKPNSSMIKMLTDLKEKQIDAVLSAGNSGAYLAGSTMVVGTINKDIRAAFAPMLKNVKTKEHQIILDGGANTENTATELVDFAKIGGTVIKAYSKNDAKVALINNGTEDKKGDELHREAHKLLSADEKINFIGNIEPRDLISSDANVIVTDGWTGNMVIKSYEGMARQMSLSIKNELKKFPFILVAPFVKPALKKSGKKFDYREYGASLVLGIDGIVLKMHGESDLYTMNKALKFAKKLAKADLINNIKNDL